MSGSGYNLIEMTDVEDNRAGIYDKMLKIAIIIE